MSGRVQGRTARWMVRIALGLACVNIVGFAALIAFTRYVPPQSGWDKPLGVVAAISDNFGWSHTGSDGGQTRYLDVGQITPENVAHLSVAWEYHTGELTRHGEAGRRSKFEATPIMAAGNLVFCTPFNRVIALDPVSGKPRWIFDPKVRTDQGTRYQFNCRGVSQWRDPTQAAGVCGSRIFTATNDRRLIALDSRTGKPCPGFGDRGQVTIHPDRPLVREVEMQFVSAPAIVGDTVVIGASSGDNVRVDAPAGTVFAFDARTGAQRWTFDPLPRRYDPVASPTWEGGVAGKTGQANVWSSITVDEARGLVFLPTSSASPDYYGGLRKGANLYADSIVALEGRTGKIAWHFQTVHHNLWDYDTPAGPTLISLRRNGKMVDALVLASKPGFVFVLDRATGKPLYPVQERSVPQTDVPGEATSPTQPFSSGLPVLGPQRIRPEDAFGVAIFDRMSCQRKIEEARNDGIFTPPSLKGSIIYPIAAGGANWGGVAVDPRSNRLIVNANNIVSKATLIPRSKIEAMRERHPDATISLQEGAPYGIMFEILRSPLGMPCNRPPWGSLVAIDLDTGSRAWSVTLGTTKEMAPLGITLNTGTPNFGGPIITSGGLVFVSAAADNLLRAFDLRTGKELWAGELPAGGQATPMTYAAHGRQYVVIAAGGHSVLGTKLGDSVMAFALPRR